MHFNVDLEFAWCEKIFKLNGLEIRLGAVVILAFPESSEDFKAVVNTNSPELVFKCHSLDS